MHSYGAWFYEQNPKRIMIPHKDIVFEGYTFEGPADAEELCRIAYGNFYGPSSTRQTRQT